MNIGITEEQRMIQRSVRDMLQERHTTEVVRKFMDEPKVSKDLQKLLANQGLLGLLDPNGSTPEERGVMNAVLVAQEAGRALLTFPLIETTVGLYALKQCKQHDDLISAVESGDKLLTVAWVTIDAKAYRSEGGFTLSGKLTEVPFAADADVILANVRIAGFGQSPNDEETVVVLDAKNPAVSVRNLKSMDETYPLYEVTLTNYPLTIKDVVKGAGQGVGHELMKEMRRLGALLLSSEMVGFSEKAMYETIEYTKQRKQFNTEIARFQALKHMAAELLLLVESAKVAVEFAAYAVENDDNADVAVGIAKSYASKTATRVGKDAIQMHGGIGFTWENDMHLYFKRARRSASVLGDSYAHREVIAKHLLDAVAN